MDCSRERSPGALWWAFALVLFGLTPSRASADETYEWSRTQKLLDDSGLTLAPSPEGKRIAYIRIVRDDVFVEDELWPVWFNWFHHLSQDRMVRRELLFETGKPYVRARIEETMRNLRSMGVFALVRIVAVQTDDPKAVGIVVHTRDVWSLRLEEQATIDRHVNYLHLLLVERNLAGLNKALSGDLVLKPDKYTLQESYVVRRVLNSAIRLEQYQGVTFSRFFSGTEGSLGGLTLSAPYYNLAQQFSWSVGGSYSVAITRALDQNANYLVYQPSKTGPSANVVYDDRSGAAHATASYRFGDEVKIALSASARYNERWARPNRETQLPDSLRAAFTRDVLPLSRRDVGPQLDYDLFVARYRTLVNFGTFSQSENVRIGPYMHLGAFLPMTSLGASYNAMVLSGAVGTTHTRGRGLFSLSLEGSTRLQNGRQIDQHVLAQMRFATPTFGPLRLVSRIALDARRHDSQHTVVTLGSDRGLRGYQARTFAGYGASRILMNVELRTLPWKLRSVYVGGVVFYDVGTLYNQTSHIRMHQAVGIGLRVLFPQFNRYPFSFDAGASFDPGFRLLPTINTSQSVPITENEEDTFP